MPTTRSAACTIATLVETATVRLHPVGRTVGLDGVVRSAACIVRAADIDTLRVGDLVVIGSADAIDADPHAVAARCADTQVAGVAWPEWMVGDAITKLAEALDAAAVPAYTLPETTRIADVIETVAAAHAAPETTRFQRLLHMQQQLVDALLVDPPVDSLINQLSSLTGGIAGVCDENGGVAASSGVLPFVLLRQEAAQLSGDGVIEVAGWVAVGRPLRSLPGEPERWLFLGRRQAGFATTYVQAAASVAASLLDGTQRISEIAAEQDLVTRAFVLRQALETEPYENSELLATRAGALGIDFRDEVRILEVRRARAQRGARARQGRDLRDHILAAFAHTFVLLFGHDAGATVLAQCTTADLDAGMDRLLRLETGLLIGVGRPMRRIGEARVSWHDATLAAQAATRTKDRRVMRYDDFDLATRMLADVDRTQMSYWVGSLLTPLREKPILLEALTAYFEQDLDIMRTAKQLSIHHNTLRYRLTKIEEALGGSLQSPARITSLHLALSAEGAPGLGAALQPTVVATQRGADVGDTDVAHGGAVAPIQFGVGEPPALD